MENAIARFVITNQDNQSLNVLLVENKTEKIQEQCDNDKILLPETEMGKQLLHWLSNKNDVIIVKDKTWNVILLDRYNERILLLNELPKEISIDELQKHKVHVYHNLCGCEKKYHVIEFISALFQTKTKNSVKIVVQHCLDCPEDKYFINTTKLMSYNKEYGYIPLHFLHEKVIGSNGQYDDYGRSEMSELKLNGYSTYLSDESRHEIISYVINTRIMLKQGVINLLESLIATNGRNPNNEHALEIWRDDLRFTLEFDISPVPQILAELY